METQTFDLHAHNIGFGDEISRNSRVGAELGRKFGERTRIGNADSEDKSRMRRLRLYLLQFLAVVKSDERRVLIELFKKLHGFYCIRDDYIILNPLKALFLRHFLNILVYEIELLNGSHVEAGAGIKKSLDYFGIRIRFDRVVRLNVGKPRRKLSVLSLYLLMIDYKQRSSVLFRKFIQ